MRGDNAFKIMTYKKFFRKEISHLQKSSFLKGKENWKISLAHNVLCNFICVCIKLKKACFCKLYTGIYWAKNLYSLLMHYTEEKQRQWQRWKHWCLCRTHKHDINSLFSFVGLYDAVFLNTVIRQFFTVWCLTYSWEI